MLETSQRMHINHMEPVLSEAIRGYRFVNKFLNCNVKKYHEQTGSALNRGCNNYV